MLTRDALPPTFGGKRGHQNGDGTFELKPPSVPCDVGDRRSGPHQMERAREVPHKPLTPGSPVTHVAAGNPPLSHSWTELPDALTSTGLSTSASRVFYLLG